MKYVIVGSGPTGLSLAYFLAEAGKEVIVIEKFNQLGGSWNMQWKEDKYFSENSPRVLFYNGNAKKFLQKIGIHENKLHNIYGNFFETNIKIFKFLYNNFSFYDFYLFTFASIRFKLYKQNITLQSWMNSSNLSSAAKKAIKILSITLCDRPDKTNVTDFFGSIQLSEPVKQMKNPNEWYEYIEKNCNIKFLKNCNVLKLINKGNIITSLLYENNNKIFEIKGSYQDKFFLCTQSDGILPILANSSNIVKSNWKPFNEMKIWSENTYYDSFGFQLHFSEKIDFNDQWCWNCIGDWNIIILPVSNWLHKQSKDPNVKTTWSCCIVDKNTKSSFLKKSVNDCNIIDTIIKESLRQLNIDRKNVYKITISTEVERKNKKWVGKNTGFTQNTYGLLNMKGNINNLFALGCFTPQHQSTIANFNMAVNSSVLYLKKYEPSLAPKEQLNFIFPFLFIFLFVLIFCLQNLKK